VQHRLEWPLVWESARVVNRQVLTGRPIYLEGSLFWSQAVPEEFVTPQLLFSSIGALRIAFRFSRSNFHAVKAIHHCLIRCQESYVDVGVGQCKKWYVDVHVEQRKELHVDVCVD